MEFWERVKTTFGDDVNAEADFWTILLGPLKSRIAEIAVTKSSQQFGREEEKD